MTVKELIVRLGAYDPDLPVKMSIFIDRSSSEGGPSSAKVDVTDVVRAKRAFYRAELYCIELIGG